MIRRRGWGATAAVGLLVAGALAALLGAGALFVNHDREQVAQHAFARAIAERASAMARALSTLDHEPRAAAIAGYHAPGFRVWLAETEPTPPHFDSWRHGERIEEIAREVLHDDHRDQVLLVALRGHPDAFDSEAPPQPITADSWRPGYYSLVVSLPLEGGGWVGAVAPAWPVSFRPGSLALLMLGLSVIAIVVITLIAAHRMTRPLRTLAGAAERLTMDLDAPPIDEDGSREVREAVAAFNSMQEQLRRIVDDRSIMIAALSHDLRTIITRLRLRTEEIDDQTQRAKAFDDLADMEVMLKEALDDARGEAAREQRQRTDLAALIGSLVDDLADAGEIAFFKGPDRLALDCRPVALRRAFANLIQNATRYGGSAEVSLRIEDDAIVIDVADRGPGIPDDRREAMFRPFVRGEPSRNRATGGTGLGLAVTRSILRGHGGDVVLLDRDGGGLIARVHLPREPGV